MIHYEFPTDWIKYDALALVNELAAAKSSVLSLQTIPYQRRWVDSLQELQLKREVEGTSKIEGAEFTQRELEAALKETPEQLFTRSQKQARAVAQTYRWIAKIPNDRPVDEELIRAIHRRIITGADEDHCPPGEPRTQDQNVNFGTPRHRGVQGGDECAKALSELVHAIQHQYRDHDPLLQAIAAHYHLAAMHPFLDGNGRTARVLEALLLQRAGLRDTSFIAMSNYYHDEKHNYLSTLAEVRSLKNDLTPFIRFSLKGVAIQSRRLLTEIQHEIKKELFRNLMFDLFRRLQTPRRRVIHDRQIEILQTLLEVESMEWPDLFKLTLPLYDNRKNPRKALVRDVNSLGALGAIWVNRTDKKGEAPYILMGIRLEWPTEITETEFFKKLKELPKAKTLSFLK